MSASKRIVITGGAGFVGSTLVPVLLAAGHRVHVVDNLMFGAEAILPHFIHPAFSFAQVDVTDKVALGPELADADVVVHLAAIVGYPLCKKIPDQARAVNDLGSRHVAELAPPSAQVIYASTGSNYGEVTGVCTEDTPLNPLSVYGETKVAGELAMREREGTISLRFATAFGLAPRLRLDLMINDFTWQALHNRFLVVYEKHFRRTFLHVRDIASAIVHAIEHPDRMVHDVYNVGHESLNYTKEDIVGLIRDRVDFVVYFADIGRDEDRRDYEVDYTRIRATGFQTKVDIDRGLHELVLGLALVKVKNPYSNV
jgi:nucleoside-diphosphate-sugar epimerase